MRLGRFVTGLLVVGLGAGLERDLEPLQSLVFPKDPVTRTEDGTPIRLLSPDEYDKWKKREALREELAARFMGGYSRLLQVAGVGVILAALLPRGPSR
jgi:hypothetical protein